MSTVFSAFIWSRVMSRAMKVPVLPTPALDDVVEKGGKEVYMREATSNESHLQCNKMGTSETLASLTW